MPKVQRNTKRKRPISKRNYRHDSYVKNLLRELLPNDYTANGINTKINYGQKAAQLDGIIKDQCAIEIESRTPKQVRGALFDLINHRYSKKLMILVDCGNFGNSSTMINMCETILRKNIDKKKYDIVLLRGNAKTPSDEDKGLILDALKKLGLIY